MLEKQSAAPVDDLLKTFNKRLGILIADSVTRVQVARSKDELLEVVRAFRKFERQGRVGFDHRNLYLSFLTLLALSALLWLVLWLGLFDGVVLGEGNTVVLALANLAVLALPLLGVSQKNNRLELLSDQIAEKWLWLDKGLQDRSHRIGELWPRWRYTFGEFAQGDEDQHLTSCLAARHRGPEHEFEYCYYSFEFTVVRHANFPDPVTKKISTTEVRSVEKRFGIICDFPYARGIAVVSGGGEFSYSANWKTASGSFNKRFKVRAGLEQDAARFLTPSVLLAIEEAAPALTQMNLEINLLGQLCLSFSNDVLKTSRSSSLVHPTRFELRLKQESAAPGLNVALNLIHTLMKYSDNNFERG